VLLIVVGLPYRLEARLSFLAFQRFHQRGFFAADVGTGAERVVDIDIDTAAQHVLSQPAVLVGLGSGFFQMLERLVMELAAQVVVSDSRTGRVARDGHAFDHRMRIEPQDVAILAGARLGFVRVAENIFLHASALGHETPLQAGGETRAAATAQPGPLDHFDHLFRRNLFFDDPAQRAVAAGLQIIFVRPRLVEMQRGVDDLVFLRRGADWTGGVRIGAVMSHLVALPHFRPSSSSSTFATSSFSW
jgi:hypothetical protein